MEPANPDLNLDAESSGLDRQQPRLLPGWPLQGWSPLRWLWVGVLLVWLIVSLPLALGQETVFLRDVFSNLLPHKAFGAEQLRQGKIPAFDPTWGLGHPYRGNPAYQAFYPDNLLYLLLPFWNAFNLHFVLHWLLALLTFTWLARSLGQSQPAALLAGVTYAGGGWFLTLFTFYNTITVAAWWPLVLVGAVKARAGGRRAVTSGIAPGIALGGLACGLALLGGEPLTALLGVVPLLLLAVPPNQQSWWRRWRHGLGVTFGIGLTGVLIALPQVVATARVLGVSYRGAHGNPESVVSSYALQPWRLLELIVAFPFGWPFRDDLLGTWVLELQRLMPYFFSLHFGIVALLLAIVALVGIRQQNNNTVKLWATLALTSLLLAMTGGWLSGLLGKLSFGVFRFPERFLVWFALALPLLAGFGLDRLCAAPAAWVRRCLGAAAALLLPVLVVVTLRPWRLAEDEALQTALSLRWLMPCFYLAFSTLILAVIAGLCSQRWLPDTKAGSTHLRRVALVALQVVALLPLAPLLLTEKIEPYREVPPWTRQVLAQHAPPQNATVQHTADTSNPTAEQLDLGPGVLNQDTLLELWKPQAYYADATQGEQQRARAHDLYPTPGMLHGLHYPLAPNLEGMAPALTVFADVNLARASWAARLNQLRVLGVEALVLYGALPSELTLLTGFEPIAQARRLGVESHLLRIHGSAPPIWWPERVHVASNPVSALKGLYGSADPLAEVQVPPLADAIEHRAGEYQGAGRVRLLHAEPDRLEFEVDSDGGIAVLRRAHHPLFKAQVLSSDPAADLRAGRRLQTLPVHLLLLGVEVPPGRHRVVVEASAAPEKAAAGVALASALGCLLLLVRRLHSRKKEPRAREKEET